MPRTVAVISLIVFEKFGYDSHMQYSYLVKVFTIDGLFVSEETGFVDEDCWDYFDARVKIAKSGEVVQLVKISNNSLIAEKIVSEKALSYEN